MKRVKLRALTYADIEKTLDWHNQKDISDLYAGHPFPVNIEMEKKWYEKILTSNFPTTVFGIETTNKKKIIGLTILRNINMINRSAEFAIYIGDKQERSKGLSKEATILTLQFGFLKLGLNRISLKVHKDNASAVKLYNSVGFYQEGELRDSVYKNGEYKSELIFSMLIKEFMQS